MSSLNVLVEVGDIDVEVTDSPVIDVSVEETVVAALTVAGPAGPPGPAAVLGHVHEQVSPSANWIVSHSLGRYPLSSELTVSGEVVHADITYPDVFTAVVTFAAPQVGTLRLT